MAVVAKEQLPLSSCRARALAAGVEEGVYETGQLRSRRVAVNDDLVVL